MFRSRGSAAQPRERPTAVQCSLRSYSALTPSCRSKHRRRSSFRALICARPRRRVHRSLARDLARPGFCLHLPGEGELRGQTARHASKGLGAALNEAVAETQGRTWSSSPRQSRFPADWLARLGAAACGDDRVAAAVPLTICGPALFDQFSLDAASEAFGVKESRHLRTAAIAADAR
jgi:hypothetical protein